MGENSCMKCRLCGKEKLQWTEYNNVEMDVNTLYHKCVEFPNNPMKIFWCENCKLAQLEDQLDEEYYKHYNLLKIENQSVAAGGQAERHESYLRGVINELADLLPKGVEKKLLDIGCGHGTVMEYAMDRFDYVEGVEASEEECQIACSKGLHVIHDFFTEQWDRKGYSVVVSTQVWEHLSNPRELMKKVNEILLPNGLVYIDVPIMRYKQGEYYGLFAEHINYWTVNSVARLMDICGFEIIKVAEVLDGNHIACFARKRGKEITFEDRFEKDAKMLDGQQNIGIWGAGIKGRIFLKQLDPDYNIIHLFDGDETLKGLYVQNFALSIEVPTLKTVNECDLIIVTAIQYKKEIIEVLRNKYKYDGTIKCIGEL